MPRAVAVNEPASAIRAAGQEVEGRLEKIFQLVSDATRNEPLRVKLFPNGIELISISVHAGPNISFELKVAGPRPIEEQGSPD